MRGTAARGASFAAPGVVETALAAVGVEEDGAQPTSFAAASVEEDVALRHRR